MQDFRLKADHRNPRGDIEEEDDPHDEELRGAQVCGGGFRFVETRASRSGAGQGLRLRGIAQGKTAGNQNAGENHAKPYEDERQLTVNLHNEEGRQSLAQKKRPHAEAHDDDAGGQSLAVGKPLGDCCDRSHVTQPDSRSANHAVTQIEERYRIEVKRQARDHVSAREHRAAGHREPLRTHFRKCVSGPGRRYAEREDRDAERPGCLGVGPAVLPYEHRLEETPGVHRTEAELEYRAEERDDASRNAHRAIPVYRTISGGAPDASGREDCSET